MRIATRTRIYQYDRGEDSRIPEGCLFCGTTSTPTRPAFWAYDADTDDLLDYVCDDCAFAGMHEEGIGHLRDRQREQARDFVALAYRLNTIAGGEITFADNDATPPVP